MVHSFLTLCSSSNSSSLSLHHSSLSNLQLPVLNSQGSRYVLSSPLFALYYRIVTFFFLIPTIFDMVLVQTDNSYSAFIISSSGQLLGTYFKFFFCPCSPYIFCPVIILLFAVFCLCWNRNVHIIMKLRAKER